MRCLLMWKRKGLGFLMLSSPKFFPLINYIYTHTHTPRKLTIADFRWKWGCWILRC